MAEMHTPFWMEAHMLGEFPEWYDTFLASRASEALDVVVILGKHKWFWLTAGMLPPTLFLLMGRIAQLLPNEKAWMLTTARMLAWLFGWTAFSVVLIAGVYLCFAYLGGDLVWSFQVRENFWPFVGKYGRWSVYGFLVGLGAGWLSRIAIARYVESWVADKLHKLTLVAEHALDHECLTDARTVSSQLPNLKYKINHEMYFEYARKRNAMFLGINENNRPVVFSRKKWKSSHVQICGLTGSGKGVQAGVVLSQSIDYGDAIWVFDPKLDEWASSVLAQQCEKSGRPFIYINLREPVPQINILKGVSADELFELFVAGFSLDEKGEAADFYRIDEREYGYQLSRGVTKDGDISLPELYENAESYIDEGLSDKAKGFVSRLKELVRIKAIQTRKGVDLSSALQSGGVIYIVGTMRGQSIPALQKIILLRVIQIIENQGIPSRHSTIFLDEIKYLLSAPTVNAFGTVRDKSCNLILTHQALQDLRDCGKDLDPDSVEGAIRINTLIKWIYKCNDPDTAEWAARMTGKIQVDKERRFVDRNEGLAETIRSERMMEQVERYYIDENMLLNLPDGCALFIGGKEPQLALVQPIQTVKQTFEVTAADPVSITPPGQELLGEDLKPSLPKKDDTETLAEQLL